MNATAPGFVRCYLTIIAMDLLPRVVGLRRTLQHVSRPAGVPAISDAALVETTARRVATAAAFYPRRALCLEQSLALQLLLRRRGVAAELKLGVQARPFYAHAWVEVEGRPVNEQSDLPLRMATFAGMGC